MCESGDGATDDDIEWKGRGIFIEDEDDYDYVVIMLMMMMITDIPVGKVKCRHKQGKTAHQLGSCLGGGSAGDECGEDDHYLHIQVKF